MLLDACGDPALRGNYYVWNVHGSGDKYCQSVISLLPKNKLMKLHCLMVDLLLQRYGLLWGSFIFIFSFPCTPHPFLDTVGFEVVLTSTEQGGWELGHSTQCQTF